MNDKSLSDIPFINLLECTSIIYTWTKWKEAKNDQTLAVWVLFQTCNWLIWTSWASLFFFFSPGAVTRLARCESICQIGIIHGSQCKHREEAHVPLVKVIWGCQSTSKTEVIQSDKPASLGTETMTACLFLVSQTNIPTWSWHLDSTLAAMLHRWGKTRKTTTKRWTLFFFCLTDHNLHHTINENVSGRKWNHQCNFCACKALRLERGKTFIRHRNRTNKLSASVSRFVCAA